MSKTDADVEDTDRQPRIRTHTEKGEELYEATKNQYWYKCDTSWKKVEDVLARATDLPIDLKVVREYEKRLVEVQDSYMSVSQEFEDYLQRTCTASSLDQLEKLHEDRDSHKSILHKMFKQLKDLKEQAMETLSIGSGSRISRISGVSSILARKRAKAEAQRVRLEFAKKQAELMREKAILQEEETRVQATAVRKKAELDASLHVLMQEENIAAVEAEAQALEDEPLDNAAAVLPDSASAISRSHITEAYVRNQRNIYRTPSPRVSPPRVSPHPTSSELDRRPSIQDTYPDRQDRYHTQRHDFGRYGDSHQDQHQDSVVEGLTQFLLRKDLVLSRFTNFDDRPEHYSTWKASFQCIIKELKVSPFEEMDLLVKYLGPTSANSARSLRAANVADPDRGVGMIWERLEDRYGRPEMIESALKSKLDSFPRISDKDYRKLYDLTDILSQIESSKEDPQYSTLLSYYDSSSGVIPIVRKLPSSIQGKWTTRASKYKKDHMVPFPPFSYFVEFVKDMSRTYNDPALMYDTGVTHSFKRNRDVQAPLTKVGVRKSNVSQSSEESDPEKICPFHGSATHPLSRCKGFRASSFKERKRLLKSKRICFRCCKSTDHFAELCKESIKCKYCGSTQHASPMHIDRTSDNTTPKDVKSHGGEQAQEDNATTLCTVLCGDNFHGRSCSKTLLVRIFPNGHPERAVKVYAIIDDQSDRTLVKSDLLDTFGDFSPPLPYTLESCSGKTAVTGRRAKGYTVQSLDGTATMTLPEMIECNDIPNVRSEIATPDVANSHPHLCGIADQIPPMDSAEISVLIGRDLVQAHVVDQQIVGAENAPIAQKLKLGWVIIGEVCLGKVHKPTTINVKRTHVLSDGRETVFDPCTYSRQVKVSQSDDVYDERDDLRVDIFQRTKDDNKIGLSVEDRAFVQLMDREFRKDSTGHWSAPLPFRTAKPKMPNNRDQAIKRAKSFDRSLQTNPLKKEHMVTFMEKIISSGAAEVAPPPEDDGEYWYLPLFGVYHPKKPDHIRGVFDSSAVHEGISLNNVLMSGPDFVNSLLGILLRFRKNEIALTADIEQMFYQFFVIPEHRDYLRFFWYEQNNPERPLIEYRMCVHVFGNKPSPAVASYGLRKTVEHCSDLCGPDVKDFVWNNFYVDDGLISLSSPDDVIDLVKRSQSVLKSEGNIRLHKIASNSSRVMEAFPTEDLGKDLKCLDFEKDYLPVQRSLGLAWDLKRDSFVFDIPELDKPFTRRGLLSTVNSVYDPVGFLAPFIIMGKILLREATPPGVEWDSPLSPEHREAWQQWQLSLEALRDVTIPRMYIDSSISHASDVELLIFSDASEKAISAAAYIRANSKPQLSFVLGKAKLAPLGGHTIPRLELCGAVLAVELHDLILEHLDITPTIVKFYTDSKVVLGYIGNDTRRFYTYVANRVERIRSRTTPLQWNYIPTHLNPADSATRYALSDVDSRLKLWLHAAPEVETYCQGGSEKEDSFSLVDPKDDKEVLCKVEVLKTSTSVPSLGVSRFEDFSSWSKLVKALSCYVISLGLSVLTVRVMAGITALPSNPWIRTVMPNVSS